MSYILSSDTLDIGRQKINSFMQGSTGVWSSDTPNYAVVSVQGALNSNKATGNYSFVTGRNNSGLSGSYQVIGGGFRNRVNGAYSSVLGGTLNTQTNISSKHNTIINGRSNTINELGSGQLLSYNTIVNGKTNSIDGAANVILVGDTNTIAGNSNIVHGTLNRVIKNGSASTSQRGPQQNFIVGNYNAVVGTYNFNVNQIRGFNNSISAATGNYAFNIGLFGKQNRVYGPYVSSIFLHGNNLTNKDTSSNNKSFIMMFGNGQSLANPLRPSTSSSAYQFILGSPNGTQSLQRKFRINFDTISPALYLNSGSVNLTGADYGEYFEWVDGNVDGEDRAGYFVEITNGKIRKAQNENAIGIVSRTASIIGDSNDDVWPGTILKDEWGNNLCEKFEEYTITETKEGGIGFKSVYFDKEGFCYSQLPNSQNKESLKIDIKKEECNFSREIEVLATSPEYSHDKKYIPRKDRSEWDVVGLLGKIRVRTSEQITGNAVDVDIATGMAKNGTKYPIIQKNKDFDGKYGIVTVFFK